ncbi:MULTISPECIES: LysR family transcriptional regulator [Brevundimonas]|uniref:LysR family transcriptional regulator n=1 Tax=Brevundimonas TaxID=41275 RepID=UPI0004625037|nr:LysR family transcriptional regulator [Brevundimonas naejangsanensis]
MDRLDAMALFVSAVDEGSLAAAARRHGRSPAAVTRAVALLEHFAGATLLLRSTRQLSLTPAGARHLATWREVLLKLDEVACEQSGGSLRGEVVLTAPELFGRLKVLPTVETFLRNHPAVSVRALLVNRVVNLIGEGVDLAVRIAPLPDSTLSAIKIGQVRILFCASPDYLNEGGAVASIGDLERHSCVGLNAESGAELWPFRAVGERKGGVRSVRVRTRLSVSHQAAVIDAALRGQGVISARSYQVAEHIAAGRLVRVLESFEPPAVPVHLVFSADRAKRGAVRSFIDHVAADLKAELLGVEANIQGRGSDGERGATHADSSRRASL